jgi:SAM-dependent methyltransferase
MSADVAGLVYARTDCRLCGSRDLVEILSFGETPLANAYLAAADLDQPELFAPLVVNFCTACTLVQLRDVVDPQVLFGHYLYVSGTSRTFVAHFAEYAGRVSRRFGLSNDSFVVDVGSNDGVLLSEFRKRGARILGVDPAANLASAATAHGIPTLPRFFDRETAAEIVREHGCADLITANNVFAHTDGVAEFALAAKALLAPGGVFVFEVQYLRDLIEQNLFDIIYHEHLCYYHVSPLVPFFDRLGLQVFDVERVGTHGGSIRVYVGWKGGPHTRGCRVDEIVAEERFLGDRSTYDAFAGRIADNRNQLRAILADIKKDGKHIVGYGAPAKATTLCYAFGIDGTMLDAIADDDARFKQGLFMPGTHIPIKSPQLLYDARPDYCLVLAWNFAGPIMTTHARFASGGGKFIVPVPAPRVV